MKLPEGYILKPTFFNENLYAVTHVDSGTSICYVTKNLGEKEKASITFTKKFNEDKYIELEDVPYRGVIFDERDPKSYTNITLDHYSEVFGATDLTFTIKCDDVTIDGDCGDVYFETENRKIELEKLCLYDVYKTTVDFKQDVIGEVAINDVSFIELTVEEHISDKARIEIKNVHSTDDNDCRLILDGNGSRDREPSYIMKDLNFKRGLYKFNAPNGVLLNKLRVIRSDKPNKNL